MPFDAVRRDLLAEHHRRPRDRYRRLDRRRLHPRRAQGHRQGRHRLYPAFPYESYTLLTDDDVLAIKAYLFSLPVAHAVAPGQRPAVPVQSTLADGGWSALYNPDQRFRPLADRSPEWNRGAYLVEASPTAATATRRATWPRRPTTGISSPARCSGLAGLQHHADPVSGVGAWSDAELAEYLRAGHARGHGVAGGPMAEWSMLP